MANFIEYVDESLKNFPQTKSLYQFRQKTIAEMTERANELVSKGIKDENVITQLIISEYPNLSEEYGKTVGENIKKKKSKRNIKVGFLGAAAYVLTLVMTYLGVSFATETWSKSWLILVMGLLLPVTLLMVLTAVKKKGESKSFSVLSRFMLAFGILIGAVLLFLFMFFVAGVSRSWIIFLLAVPMMLVGDAVFSIVTNQKFALGTYMIYIPICASLLYVALGLTGILPWHPGWMMIVLSVIVDLVIAGVEIFSRSNKKMEEEEWTKE